MTFIWNVIKTMVWIVILAALWEWLEISLYGAPQPRVVDDIMILFFIPFVYSAVSKDTKKTKK